MKIAIVGNGLAGSFLALSLLRQMEIKIFDAELPSASKVSAGIINVITGQNFSLTWNANELIRTLREIFYEHSFLLPFYHPKEIYRPFPNVSVMNKTYEKTLDKTYSLFAEIENVPRETIRNPLGGIRIKNVGYVEVSPMLETLHKHLKNEGVKFVSGKIIPSEIVPEKEKVFVNGEVFDLLVFCEGAGIFSNPFWQGTRPLSPLKGETFLIELAETDLDYILIKKAYIIPVGTRKYIVGSTYERGVSDPSPTEKGKKELLQKLFSVLPKQEYKILKHEGGVRVTTYNRRFFIGRSRISPRILFFNGLGTKGLLSAPYGAGILKDYLLEGKEIPKEISTERFF